MDVTGPSDVRMEAPLNETNNPGFEVAEPGATSAQVDPAPVSGSVSNQVDSAPGAGAENVLNRVDSAPVARYQNLSQIL